MANGGIIGPVVTPPNVQTQSAPGVWTLQEAQEYIRQGLWPRRYDPLFNYTTLLLSGNGSNNATNNSFQDSSTNNFTITRNGNTTQGTFSPFSQTGWGNYFDGTSDYLSVADNSVLRLGTSAFTIECWVYRAANGTAHSIVAKGGASTGWLLEVTSGNVLQFTHTTTAIATSLPVYAGNWVHVAAVREGTGSNQFKLYINGTLAKTDTVATDFTQTDTLYIGANRSAATTMNGYISNLRITNGTALYTAQFTPSTTALTTTSQGALAAQVELLTCQSNRFVDNSGNGFTVTRNGDTSIQAFSPFNATTPWDPNLYGGSGYFDGSGDYLSVADNAAFDLGGSVYTIEAWVYPTALNDYDCVIAKWGATAEEWALYYESGQFRLIQSGYSYAYKAYTVTNQWVHVAAVYDGTNTQIYVNGQAGTSFAGNGISNSTQNVSVGAYTRAGTLQYMEGYISNCRIVKGTAVYTSAFTPPTAPLTAITNTSLLLNFTNIGVTDATSKNTLETVGDAKISTAQSKFGGSSIVFDGTGDYLLQPTSSLLSFGSGDFTIESWVRIIAHTNADSAICLNWTGTWAANYWALHPNHSSASQKFTFWAYNYSTSAPILTSSTTVATGNWYHIAVTRSGNTWRMFVNGTVEATQTSSAALDAGTSYPLYVSGALSGQVLNGYIQDLRITKGVARYTENFAVPDSAFATLGNTPPSIDPYFDYTTLLLPGSGSNNATNNSFLDSSANNFTITRNGNTTQGTFSPFSQTGWGNYFDGSGDYLEAGTASNWTFLSNTTALFSIEAWVYLSSAPATLHPICFTNAASSANVGFGLWINSSRGVGAEITRGSTGTRVLDATTTGTIQLGAWNYVAITYDQSLASGNCKIYINNAAAETFNKTANTPSSSNPSTALLIGRGNSSTYAIGYYGSLRISNVIRTITVPTAPYTSDANTSLLTCQSNRFIDNSSNNFTITRNGDTRVVAFSPFNPSASWSAATYGGSGYFDGSGDYLNGIGTTSSFNFMHNSSALFTFEAWLFRTATGGATQILFTNSDQTSSNIGVAISIESGVPLLYITRGVAASVVVSASAATAIPVGAWSYIAVTYDQSLGSNNAKWYVNGTLDSQTSKTANAPSGSNATNAASVGGNSTGTSPFTGYISNIRISNVIRTISTPTTPYTNDANTSLLLGFTNAGIYDATSKNDLETVGNAQISTAQSVWTAYGASMYFNGTTDYLYSPYSTLLSQLSGDFTFEAWIYPTATSTLMVIASSEGASTNWNFRISSGNKLVFEWVNSTPTGYTATSSGNISQNVWTYVAAVKSGATITLYINGSADGTVSTTGSYRNLTANGVGIGRYSNVASGYFNGYIQDFRMTIGIARYTANFQPPSAPLALR